MPDDWGELLVADWVVTTASDRPAPMSAVRVVGNRVTEIGPSRQLVAAHPHDQVHTFADAAIAPGFVNAHTHTYALLTHGMSLPAGPRDFGEFLTSVWWPHVENRLDREMLVAANRWGGAQALLSGVTTLYDIVEAPCAAGALLSEIASRGGDVGVRTVLSFEATERISADNGRAGLRENAEFIEEVSAEHEPLTTGLMCWHTSYSCTGGFIQNAAEVARDLDVACHFHCNEGTYEPERTRNDHGMSTVEYYESLGITDYDLIASQCVVLTEAEIEIIADAEIAVTHMPLSNGGFGAGVAPIPELLEHDVVIGLGSDGFTADFFEVVREAAIVHRARLQDGSVMPAAVVFDMATRGGGQALGLDRLGTLQQGSLADIQVINLDLPTPATAENLLDQIVFRRRGGNVTDVMVDGAWRVRGRELVDADLEELRAATRHQAARLWSMSEAGA
jgi:5-methylthioadenosine/S-adenosylhomocysteine deaminase